MFNLDYLSDHVPRKVLCLGKAGTSYRILKGWKMEDAARRWDDRNRWIKCWDKSHMKNRIPAVFFKGFGKNLASMHWSSFCTFLSSFKHQNGKYFLQFMGLLRSNGIQGPFELDSPIAVFLFFYFRFLQKYIFVFEIYRNIFRPPRCWAAGTWPPRCGAAGAFL